MKCLMFKFNLFLTMLFAACALGIVNVQHEARKLNMALENKRKTERELDIEWGRLQLEQSTLVARRQIEDFARKQLSMELPSAQHVQFISTREEESSKWAELSNVK